MYGTCEIFAYLVEYQPQPNPPNVASVLYFKIWPEVRKAAENIIKECLTVSDRLEWRLQALFNHYSYGSFYSDGQVLG